MKRVLGAVAFFVLVYASPGSGFDWARFNLEGDGNAEALNLAYAIGACADPGFEAIFATRIVAIREWGVGERGAVGNSRRGNPTNAVIEFEIVELIEGQFGEDMEVGKIKRLPVERRPMIILRPLVWERVDVGDFFMVFVRQEGMSFEEAMSDLRMKVPITEEELAGEVRDLKFVMEVCHQPLAEQFAMRDLWAHVERHQVDRMGHFLTHYVHRLYQRRRAAEPFLMYEYLARVGVKPSRSAGMRYVLDTAHDRSYSPRVSDDSLATYILGVLRAVRFLGEAAEITKEQRWVLTDEASHILNLTREEREPSNWERLKRVRGRSEIQEEVSWLRGFREGLPEATTEDDEKLYKRMDVLLERFSA
jgi:hypothetical protein